MLEIIFNAFSAVFLSIPNLVGRALYFLAANLLNWVTSPSFISLSYTNAGMSKTTPGYNPIVGIGWSMMRDFANIIIVISLVVIGLATVLRIEEYQAKKTLPRLVLVALLVNFSPVIAGLVIDASNIVMFSLLKNLTNWQALVDATTKLGLPKFSLSDIIKKLTSSSYTAELLGVTLYFWMGAIIFLIYIFIYLVRYIALWVLVIFSPLAFACYILKGTQQYFSLWWKQFLGWSFIGVTAAFFLSLANQLFFLIDEQNVIIGGTTGLSFFSKLFPYFIPIVFLFLGFFVGFQTSAYGSNAILKLGKIAALGATVGVSSVSSAAGMKAKSWVEEKTDLRKKAGTVVRSWEKIPIARWFLPERLRRYAEFGPAIEKARETLSYFSPYAQAHRFVFGDLTGEEKSAVLVNLATTVNMETLFDTYRKKYEKKLRRPVTTEDLLDLNQKEFEEFREEIGRVLEIAQRGGKFNQIVRSDPRLARIAAGRAGRDDIKTLPRDKTGQDEAVRIIIEEVQESHIEKWEPEVLQDKKVIEVMMARKGRAFWERIGRVVKRGRETVLNTIEEMFSEWLDAKIPDENQRNALLATPGGRQSLWEEYRKWFKDNYKEDAYFAYAETERAREQKWTMPRYIPLDIRDLLKKPETKLTPAEKAKILALPEREPAPLP